MVTITIKKVKWKVVCHMNVIIDIYDMLQEYVNVKAILNNLMYHDEKKIFLSISNM